MILARRNDFRGFDQSKKDDLTQKAGEGGQNLRGDTGGANRQPHDLSEQRDRSERQGLQGQQGRDASSAFQGLGPGDDSQRFSDRGRASRQSAGNLKAGGGQLRGAGGDGGGSRSGFGDGERPCGGG